MRKLLRCKDIGVDCDFVASGKTDEEVLKRAAEHAKKDHGIKKVTKDYIKAGRSISTLRRGHSLKERMERIKALIISADNFEDTELLVPYYRFREEGFDVDIASVKKGTIKGKRGYETNANKALRDVIPDEYDILLLPGGKAPEIVRKDKNALEIAKHFFEKNKPVSAICHGPQILISAGVLKSRHATCYKSVSQEMKDAGAIYEDKEVVVDGNLVTSRQPSDLPAFMRETLKMLKKS